MRRSTRMVCLSIWVLGLLVLTEPAQTNAQRPRKGTSSARKSQPAAAAARFDAGDSALKIPLDIDNSIIRMQVRVNNSKPLKFIFDTGADLMVIPVYVARREGVAFGTDHPGSLASSVGGTAPCFYDGVEVRSALSGRSHTWPCAFADSVTAPLVVGRAGFLDEFSAAVTPHHFVVSYPAPLGRFLRLLTRAARDPGPWQSI